MASKIQHIRDTASNWTSNNPTPFQGELCYETDTGRIKLGDGTSTWNSLAYTGEYSVQDGELSEINFTAADHAKLDGLPALANITGGTMTGDLNIKGYKETVIDIAQSTYTPSLTAGTMYNITQTCTFTTPTVTNGKSFMVLVGTGTHVTWSGSNVIWNGGGEPSKSSNTDLYTFIAFGSFWYAAQAGTGYA